MPTWLPVMWSTSMETRLSSIRRTSCFFEKPNRSIQICKRTIQFLKGERCTYCHVSCWYVGHGAVTAGADLVVSCAVDVATVVHSIGLERVLLLALLVLLFLILMPVLPVLLLLLRAFFHCTDKDVDDDDDGSTTQPNRT